MGVRSTNSQQDNDIDCIKEGCNSLITFSNHLMLVLVAIIALASNSAFQGNYSASKILFSSGIVISIFSFYWGYSANFEKINQFLIISADYKKLKPREERITLDGLGKIKKYVQWQYVATLLAIACIAISILTNIYLSYPDKLNDVLCVQKSEGKLEPHFSSAGNEVSKAKGGLVPKVEIPIHHTKQN